MQARWRYRFWQTAFAAPVAVGLLAVGLLAVGLAVPASPAAATEVIEASAAPIRVEVNKGHLLRLPRPAASVFVADPAIADIQVKSPRLVYLLGKRAGRTSFYAVDNADQVLTSAEVVVSYGLSGLRDALDTLLPGNDIEIGMVNDALLLEGSVESAADAEEVRRVAASFIADAMPQATPGETQANRTAALDGRLINRIRVTTPVQVNLRVRVAEISRDVDKQLGFNWTIAGRAAGIAIGIATANPFAANVTQHTLSAGRGLGGRWDLNTVIDALEEEGLVSVLAEPNLTAISGETASFLAGGEFPILVPDSNGRVTIEFKPFGVALAFTPTILGPDRINLHVAPEVSQLSTTNAVTLNDFQVPSLTTRRADTTVELGSGQSFAIAGLIQNNASNSISKFPLLGDIPVLGRLFRSDRFRRDESELVIIVTPYVVRPVSASRMATPLDGFAPPHDAERYLIGGSNRRNPVRGQPATVDRQGRDLIGPVGLEMN